MQFPLVHHLSHGRGLSCELLKHSLASTLWPLEGLLLPPYLLSEQGEKDCALIDNVVEGNFFSIKMIFKEFKYNTSEILKCTKITNKTACK